MKIYKKIKKTHDGLALLNIGSGLRTHPEWNNLDFSPYARLVHHRRLAQFLNAVGLLSDVRYDNLRNIDPEIIHWDVYNGLPFHDNVFDIVYHSHLITHIDHDAALFVTKECHRKLKPSGIIRVVVPDLEKIVNIYNEALADLDAGRPIGNEKHAEAVDELFELMVRRTGWGTSRQSFLVQIIERLVRGDITKTGELRRWHYDRYSMGQMLADAGFREVSVMSPETSGFEGWNSFGLDLEEDGSVYKPGSLYMEGLK